MERILGFLIGGAFVLTYGLVHVEIYVRHYWKHALVLFVLLTLAFFLGRSL